MNAVNIMVKMMNQQIKRCLWVDDDPLMILYHDREWGVPVHEDNKLFEFLILDGFQAGLSWSTILKKRFNFRRAFDSFDPAKIARYREDEIKRLLANPGIVRNHSKILATITNARKFLEIQREFFTFDKYVWSFVGGRPIVHEFKKIADLPAKSEESDKMSEDLKKRGFKFVGSTICYAFMQAAGLVNDHVVDCFRYREIS